MTGRATVLVVDDEPAVTNLLAEALGRDGFDVIVAADGPAGLEACRTRRPDLVILDVRLPQMDGFEVLRHLRHDPATARLPVIVLTGEDGEAERVAGLELGADDYVPKPFSPRELAARIRSVLRRAQAQPRLATTGTQPLRHGQLVVDAERHAVTFAGAAAAAPLTATEFRIVHTLVAQAGKVLSRDQISAAVHGEAGDPADRTIDAHIKSIRKKLGPGGDEIETVRGVGYRLR